MSEDTKLIELIIENTMYKKMGEAVLDLVFKSKDQELIEKVTALVMAMMKQRPKI